MKNIKCKQFLIFCMLSMSFSNDSRIVTIGGSVTEIVFALGMGDRVIAVDQSSTIPSKVSELPQVGYIRSISAEGVLSVNPTIILTSSDIGPPNVVDQIRSAGIQILIFDSPKDYNGVITLVREISKSLEVVKLGNSIINKLLEDKQKILELTKDKNADIAFFMDATNSGSFNAAGGGTRANYLINIIGGINIYENSFKRYSKVSSESLLELNPQIILIGSMSDKCVLKDELYKDRSLQIVDAVMNEHIYVIDLGYYLTFGSNISDAVLGLIDTIHQIDGEK